MSTFSTRLLAAIHRLLGVSTHFSHDWDEVHEENNFLYLFQGNNVWALAVYQAVMLRRGWRCELVPLGHNRFSLHCSRCVP